MNKRTLIKISLILFIPLLALSLISILIDSFRFLIYILIINTLIISILKTKKVKKQIKKKPKKKKIKIIKKQTFKKTKEKDYFRIGINYVFQVTLIIFLIFLIIKQLSEDFLSFINTNYFLILVVILGTITIFFPKKEIKNKIQ